MFFADPVAAFANIGRALRPGARLVLMVWQGRERNEWATALHDALAPGTAPATAAAFSLADPGVATDILGSAGFASVAFADLHEPVFYGPSVDAAHEAVVGLFMGQKRPVDDAVEERLRTLLQAHLSPEGVLFDSRAWIVTARRA